MVWKCASTELSQSHKMSRKSFLDVFSKTVFSLKILESINTAISKCGPHNYGDYDLFSDLDILVQYLLN